MRFSVSLYAGYEEKMRRAGLIDFDDMMVLCLELFTERKDILSAWQRRYRYILIDEFQDINRLQYEIVRMLAKPEDNLFIVGDDDRVDLPVSWAKPEIMLGFERDYPGAGRILLDVNYRSTEEIVAPALRLIGKTRNVFKGHPYNGTSWEERDPEALAGSGEENLAIARRYSCIICSRESGRGISLFLYRTNAGPRFLMEKLMEYNFLPDKGYGAEHSMNTGFREISLTYIRIAMEAGRGKIFCRSSTVPKRYISRDAMPDETVSFERMKAFYAEKDWIAERIESLEGGICRPRPDVTSGSRQLYPPGHGIRRISDRSMRHSGGCDRRNFRDCR